MKHFSLFLFTFVSTISSVSFGQVINGYARVTNISGGNMLVLNNVDETGDSFEDAEYLLIIQMQDDVIGSTANNATFGNIGVIGSAGLYEVVRIQSHVEAAGIPQIINLESTLTNTYNTGPNSTVQVVTFPTFGSPDYTLPSAFTAKAWDGNTGGVLAFDVKGVLTLANDLSADNTGFRGAGPNAGGSAGCSGGSNYRVTSQANMADKGESIYRVTAANQAAGMGKILNGGGGGNSHNGGGAGGGNFTAGGDGGPGWPTCTPSAGGLGGIALAPYIAGDRVFAGGGGGAGEGNNNLATDGGDGGGIIFLKAGEIRTTGSCGGVSITADGESIAFAGNDGGGGGGAGGSIIIQAGVWSVAASCPLTISASGGDGGGVNSGATHGGGGGGGQGAIIYTVSSPISNVTSTSASGTGGCNNNSNPCNSIAGSGGGPTNSGVFISGSTPLPIELLNFSAKAVNNELVEVTWVTASETNNDYFIIERAGEDLVWENIGKVKGSGTTTIKQNYFHADKNPLLGLSYYRLTQVDLTGTRKTYDPEVVEINGSDQIRLYPNPTDGMITVETGENRIGEIGILNSLGQNVSGQCHITVEANRISIDMLDLPSGTYYMNLNNTYRRFYRIR